MNNDLISRSALLGGYDVRKVTEYDESGCGLEYKAVSVEAIEAAPAVDAEPVRHGRWIPFGHDDADEGLYKCSVCEKKQYNGFGDIKEYLKYCPECGAKMDCDTNAAD